MVEPPADSQPEPAPGMPDARAPEHAGERGPGRRGVVVPLALVASLAVVAILAATGLLTGAGRPPAGASALPDASAAAPGAEGVSPGASGAATTAPAGAARDGLIAVVDVNGDLATMDERGGSVVSYAVPGVAFGLPSWSPDGSRIAAVGTAAADTAIYVFTIARGVSAGPAGPVVIYRSPNRPAFYLYWTPDSRHVAFLASESAAISLRIAPADGSAPVDGSGPGAIIRRGAPLYFDWEGTDRLLLHVGSGSGAFVGEVGLDGSSVAPAMAGTGDFRAASASGDGRYVAYARSTTTSSGQVVVAARDGTGQHESPVFGPAAFVFDPTGDTLAMIAAATPGAAAGFPLGPLRLVDAGSGATRTLVDGPVIGFFWAPDGRTIAALRVARPGDQTARGVPALMAASRGGAIAAATPAPEVEIWLAFIDVATGAVRSERVVQPAGVFVNQILPYFDQYALSHRVWAPDSASIVLPLADGTGRTRVVVVRADGTDSRPIANGESAFWSP